MKTLNNPQFKRYYSQHCKHFKLMGLQPKTIEAYSRAIRRIGDYFDGNLDDLSHDQLLDYFHSLLERLSWSAVKRDLMCQHFSGQQIRRPISGKCKEARLGLS